MSSQEKTEQPTGKRLDQAKERGQIAKSRDLIAVGVLLTGSLGVYYSCGSILHQFRTLIELLWNAEAFTSPGYFALGGSSTFAVTTLFDMIAPSVMAMLAAAVLLNLVQTKGFNFSPKAMGFRLSNLNPMTGFKRMFSTRSMVELVKSTAKLLIVCYAVYSVMWSERSSMAELADRELSGIVLIIGELSLRIVFRVCLIMLFLSLLDYLYEKWQTRKDLMMTRQEVKEEAKQSDGNPQIKAKIRSAQRALSRQRMMSKVPKASVIITNPTHYAVVLSYKQGMEAPRLVAKGVDFLAKKIIAVGRKHGVPVVQNPPLARALYKQVKLDETIPVILYRAVAKILAYIYQQKQSMRRN
ncbi:MAG: flagellar biosynthesis protein FlhB [Syntrophobacter sp.]